MSAIKEYLQLVKQREYAAFRANVWVGDECDKENTDKGLVKFLVQEIEFLDRE